MHLMRLYTKTNHCNTHKDLDFTKVLILIIYTKTLKLRQQHVNHVGFPANEK